MSIDIGESEERLDFMERLLNHPFENCVIRVLSHANTFSRSDKPKEFNFYSGAISTDWLQ
jgi:hypothetical protein